MAYLGDTRLTCFHPGKVQTFQVTEIDGRDFALQLASYLLLGIQGRFSTLEVSRTDPSV